MINTTLCYITQGDRVLMLHRIKKKKDINKDKWIGVGGKFEGMESPDECLLREVREETGLHLTDYRYRGLVTFVSNEYPTEYMHLFTAADWEGEPHPVTRANWPGSKRRSCCLCPCGRETRFSSGCWTPTIPFSR